MLTTKTVRLTPFFIGAEAQCKNEGENYVHPIPTFCFRYGELVKRIEKKKQKKNGRIGFILTLLLVLFENSNFKLKSGYFDTGYFCPSV